MKIEEQVCSLELSKRLNELGVKQESCFWWCCDLGTIQTSPNCKKIDGVVGENGEHCSAFTVAELGEMLPMDVFFAQHLDENGEHDGLWACYKGVGDFESGHDEIEPQRTEAEARANMMIFLIEEGLLKLG